MPVAKLKCKCHGEYQPRENLITTPKGKFCSYDLAIKWANEQTSKRIKRETAKVKQVAVKKVKAQKSKDKHRLKELMSRGAWYKKLQRVVNQWVVHVRDKDRGCYTCGKYDASIKYDCGHRHHAGSGGADRRTFTLENLHKQCSVNCNQFGSGMPKEYDIALDAEYGQGFADKLNCIANYPTLKEIFPTWQDIEEEINRYCKILRDHGIKPNLKN